MMCEGVGSGQTCTIVYECVCRAWKCVRCLKVHASSEQVRAGESMCVQVCAGACRRVNMSEHSCFCPCI